MDPWISYARTSVAGCCARAATSCAARRPRPWARRRCRWAFDARRLGPNDICNRKPGDFTIHWIGLRENLQETMVFSIKLFGLSCKFSHHPILWTIQHCGFHCELQILSQNRLWICVDFLPVCTCGLYLYQPWLNMWMLKEQIWWSSMSCIPFTAKNVDLKKENCQLYPPEIGT